MAEVGSTANKYEILAKLATGGMAEIFLARGVGSVGVARYVVLKRILGEFAQNKSFVRMFLDEARLVAQLQHPNIAQVHDVGQLGASYFFTMEYVHGETVRAVLSQTRKARGQIPLGAILAITAGAAAGLHHAHEKLAPDGKHLQIVHRDVTPSNLMISFEGNVKVVDFGVAKATGGDYAPETKSGTIKGKTSYLSPEQCQGSTLDRRSDIFSLGIVVWEMLTCERLFRKANEFDSMAAIVNDDAPPPSKVNPHVPPEMDALVAKLLERDRDKRFSTAQDVIDAVEDTAIAIKAKMTPSVLVRMMRETFGVRPEPWIVLEQQKIEAPTVTVTADFGDSKSIELTPADLAPSVTKDVKLEKLPGLELVDQSGNRMQTESESGALAIDLVMRPAVPPPSLRAKKDPTLPPYSDDGDLAIPRAPVLPRKDPTLDPDDDDELSAPRETMEDLPTSRWNVVVPSDLGIDLERAMASGPSGPIPVLDQAVIDRIAPPVTGRIAAQQAPVPTTVIPGRREQRVRTPVAGIPIQLPTGPHLPLDADGADVGGERGTGPQQPLDRPGAKPIPGEEVTPTPTPTLVDRSHGDGATQIGVPPAINAMHATDIGDVGDATTIEPQRPMRVDPTPTPDLLGAQEGLAPPSPLRNPKVLAILGGAIVLVIAIIVVASRGSSDPKVAVDAAVTAPAALHADAAEPETPELDAAPDAIVVDAGVKPKPPITTGGSAAPRPYVAPKPKITKAEITKLYETAAYAKLVTTCAAGGASAEPSICVLGACRAGNAAKARQWYMLVPRARRGALQTTCLSLGVTVE